MAMTIIAPSMIMKSASSEVKSVPLKPPASSTQRYTLRAKMVAEDARRPMSLLVSGILMLRKDCYRKGKT